MDAKEETIKRYKKAKDRLESSEIALTMTETQKKNTEDKLKSILCEMSSHKLDIKIQEEEMDYCAAILLKLGLTDSQIMWEL